MAATIGATSAPTLLSSDPRRLPPRGGHSWSQPIQLCPSYAQVGQRKPALTAFPQVRAGSCVVGVTGFEPAAFRSQSGCATKLRHIPVSRAADHPAIMHRTSAGPQTNSPSVRQGHPPADSDLSGRELGASPRSGSVIRA